MDFKIIKQEKNPFLEREKITLEIKNKTTLSAEEIKSLIGKDPELIVVKKINTNCGSQTSSAEVIVYDNKKSKERIETIPKKVRKKMEADEKTKKETEKKARAEAKQKAEEEAKQKEAETKPEEKTE
jgi:ribosomal protein S24E